MVSHKLKLYGLLNQAKQLLPLVSTDVERSTLTDALAKLKSELPNWGSSPERSELRFDLSARRSYIKALPATSSILALMAELEEEWARVEECAAWTYPLMVAGHISHDSMDWCFSTVEDDISSACSRIPEGPQALLDIQSSIDYDAAHATEHYRRFFDESPPEQISYL